MYRLDLTSDRLKLEYPCQWVYKVIGASEQELRDAIALIMVDRAHTVTMSNTSSSGKYVSLNVEIEVVDEEDRRNVYEVLCAHAATKYIL